MSGISPDERARMLRAHSIGPRVLNNLDNLIDLANSAAGK